MVSQAVAKIYVQGACDSVSPQDLLPDSRGIWDDDSFLGDCPPEVRGLYLYWAEKRGGKRLPARADIDPIEMREWLGRLLLYEVVAGDDGAADFRYRLVGSRLVHVFGADLTGKRVSEGSYMSDPAITLNNLRAVLANGRPRYRTDRLPGLSNRATTLERLFLPLASDGETPDMLLVFVPRVEIIVRQPS